MKTFGLLLIALGILYLLIVVLAWVFQERLLFFPQPILYQVDAADNVEEVFITTAGGHQLHGWLNKATVPGRQKLIIYFGGNAEEVSHMIYSTPAWHGWAYLLVNYPGYGNSEGKPGKKSFYESALAIYDYAFERADIDTLNIVVMGRSIGTASAVYLARHRKVRAAILISPFAGMKEVAQSAYPFLPVGWLLRQNFKPVELAPAISAPLLAMYGTHDQIIHPRHSIELAQHWKGENILIPLEGYGHNDLFSSSQLWVEIEAFLAGL
jgi:uncharacterized protein